MNAYQIIRVHKIMGDELVLDVEETSQQRAIAYAKVFARDFKEYYFIVNRYKVGSFTTKFGYTYRCDYFTKCVYRSK